MADESNLINRVDWNSRQYQLDEIASAVDIIAWRLE